MTGSADGCNKGWLAPDWPAPRGVRALITTRPGGVSRGTYGVPPHGRGGMNLGRGIGDDDRAVDENRARLRAVLPADPRWLRQVHGATVVDAAHVHALPAEADAACTDRAGVVAAVLVADCMPVLLADTGGRCVGVAHAGWRGLAAGVVQAAVGAVRARLGECDAELVAYLGPAIGPRHFEVGAEVLEAMQRRLPRAKEAFAVNGDRYLADLFQLGRQALSEVGVERVYGGSDCTYSDAQRWYSYRRDRVTGRQAALIWRV